MVNPVVYKNTLLTVCFVLVTSFSFSQMINWDSCGRNASPYLNQYEVFYFDSVLFKPIELKTKGQTIRSMDMKNGFDLGNKKLAFFTCSDTVDHGFSGKDKYFMKLRSWQSGPRGIYVLTKDEKERSGGYDAIIMINCKFYSPGQLIARLIKQK
jgi:hypothetical protein